MFHLLLIRGSMSSSPLSSPLRPDDAVFIQQGISICVASRDVRHVPSLSRALGCRVDGVGNSLRLVLVKSQSEALVRDLDKSGLIAAVFTQPTTHRTLQIKGSDARILAATPDDEALAQLSMNAFAAEILPLGFSAEFTRRLFHYSLADLCVVTFTPQDVFSQTPGPNAGARMERSA